MVVERAEFVVKEGQEKEFETAMAEGVRLLGGAAGAKSVTLGRGVEAPSKYLLLIEWEEVDSHVAFTKTPEFENFRINRRAVFCPALRRWNISPSCFRGRSAADGGRIGSMGE